MIPFHQARDFSAVISTGFQFIREHARTLYRPLFFICLPIKVVASVLLGSFFHNVGPGRTPGGLNSVLTMMGGYLLIGISYMLASVIICEYMRWVMVHNGERPTVRQLWRESRRHFWLYFAISLITAMIMGVGFMLFLIPFFFLLVVFQFSYPLHAFERASVGDCIGRAFSLVWGKWWMTFGMLLVLFGMSILLNGAIDLPTWLITGFGSLSGISELDDPEGTSRRLQWFFTFFALIGEVSALLLMPFLQVPMCFQMLSVTEIKEAPGLMTEVQRFTLDAKI